MPTADALSAATASLPPCSIALLAGGRGQRMGGQDKGLVTWQGEPMIAPIARAARLHTDDLIISCNRNTGRYGAYADRLVSDASDDFPGPMAGILAALAIARQPWLLILPCDMPRIDSALILALRQATRHGGDTPLMVRQGAQWQPLLCAIPQALAGHFQQAWERGERSARAVMLALGALPVPLDEDDVRLANLNTAALLARDQR